MNHFLKLTFSLMGIITAYTILRIFFISSLIGLDLVIIILVPLLTGAFFYYLTDKSIKYLSRSIDSLEIIIHNMSVYEISASIIGLISGLIVANLVAIPINKVDIIGIPISVCLNLFLGYLGVYVAISKKGEASSILNGNSKRDTKAAVKLLDTSTIIDGRIIDVCNAGFLDGSIVIPSFVLEELHHISDSSDSIKRARGRRGLDVLDILQKDQSVNILVENMQELEGQEVDDKLVKAAKRLNAKIITNDYNLNKVARIQGVDVLNLNDLANAVKPLALPGEEMPVQVVKEGRENGQGIGYLNDGTMIVVEGGKKHINETLEVVVTSVLQTSAGRMIFAKPKGQI